MKEPNKQARVDSIYGNKTENTVKKVRLVLPTVNGETMAQENAEARALGLFYSLTWVVVTQIILM